MANQPNHSNQPNHLNQERYFQHEGVRYRFLTWKCEADTQAVPIVLLHGFAQSAESWNEVAAILRQTRPVVALDFIGHGGSDQPSDPRPYQLDQAARMFTAFLAFIAAEYKAPALPVVGYSMGGRIALAAAIANPHPFAALVLEGVGLGPATAEDRAAVHERDAANAARLREQGVPAFMDTWEHLPLFATQRDLPPDVRARVRAGRLANDAEALARTFEHAGQHVMPSRAATLETLSGLRAGGTPLLYLAGERDEKYRALASQATQAGATAYIVPGVGHNTHLEAPSVFVREVASFLSAERV